MAWSVVTPQLAWASDGTAGTSVVSNTIAGAIPVGDVVIVVVAKDNAATADGNTSEVTSVTASSGTNTFVKLREFCNSRGAANGGATVSVWYTLVTSQIGASSTFTANFSDSRTASGISAAQFRIAAGGTVSIAANATDSAVTSSTVASLSISGLASAEYLFVRGSAIETNTSIAGNDTVGWTNHFFPVNTAGGGAAANMALQGEYHIATGTGDTSAPTWTTTGDNASVMLALLEVVPAVFIAKRPFGLGQAVNRASTY